MIAGKGEIVGMRKKTEWILCCGIVVLSVAALVGLAYFRSLPVLSGSPDTADPPVNSSGAEPETVYVTPSGSRYHTSQDCPSLARSETVLETTEEAAAAQGLTPCSRCKKTK